MTASTLADKTIVERKGDDALDRATHRVLDHIVPPAGPASEVDDEPVPEVADEHMPSEPAIEHDDPADDVDHD